MVHAPNGIFDGAVAGAPTQVALQRPREIVTLRLVQGRCGDDHSGGTEPALKALRIEERLLHRMQRAAAGQSLDGRHIAVLGAIRRNHAGVHRLAVEQHRAGAAIAGIATLFDAMGAELAEEGPQTLSGPWLRRMRTAIHAITHGAGSPESSSRISSASTRVTRLRHCGAPCTSST